MIIAVDFDGTLCTDVYPDIGVPNYDLIEELKYRHQLGDTLILWTCRCEEKLDESINWCKQMGLHFDYVNCNTRGVLNTYGTESRKVFADVYLDDRACSIDTFLHGRIPCKLTGLG